MIYPASPASIVQKIMTVTPSVTLRQDEWAKLIFGMQSVETEDKRDVSHFLR